MTERLEELGHRVYCTTRRVVSSGKGRERDEEGTLWTRRAVLAFGCAATGLAGMRVSVVNGTGRSFLKILCGGRMALDGWGVSGVEGMWRLTGIRFA